MSNKIILTEDGSHTIFVPELDEHYHSTHGAINESLHIYINAGLKHHTSKELNVFEVGFGTGLNAYLTLVEAIQQKRKISYYSIEKYPIDKHGVDVLNYPKKIYPEFADYYKKLHQTSWNEIHQLSPEFILYKIKADLKTFEYQDVPKFDLIYFDAFAPNKQVDMWSEEIFRRIARHSNKGAVIVTYCVRGAVRRLLDKQGFEMERIPGPKGKKKF